MNPKRKPKREPSEFEREMAELSERRLAEDRARRLAPPTASPTPLPSFATPLHRHGSECLSAPRFAQPFSSVRWDVVAECHAVQGSFAVLREATQTEVRAIAEARNRKEPLPVPPEATQSWWAR